MDQEVEISVMKLMKGKTKIKILKEVGGDIRTERH